MDDLNKNKLWETYSKTKSKDIREKIIIEYATLVKLVAGRLNIYLGQNVEYDDLVSYGVFGLIDAIDKFDYKKGVKFETYASLRIRGSILDQIRKMDWVPRSLRHKQKKIEKLYRQLESELGRPVTDEEMAKNLEITIDEYNDWISKTNMLNIISLDEYIENGSETRLEKVHDNRFAQPESVIEKEEIKKILMEAIDKLTEKEKKVIILYYYEELTLKEISHIMEVSESRISQLHTKALQKMKKKLGQNIDILMI